MVVTWTRMIKEKELIFTGTVWLKVYRLQEDGGDTLNTDCHSMVTPCMYSSGSCCSAQFPTWYPFSGPWPSNSPAANDSKLKQNKNLDSPNLLSCSQTVWQLQSQPVLGPCCVHTLHTPTAQLDYVVPDTPRFDIWCHPHPVFNYMQTECLYMHHIYTYTHYNTYTAPIWYPPTFQYRLIINTFIRTPTHTTHLPYVEYA